MADKKLRFALMDKFIKKMSARGNLVTLNRFKEQWAADSLIDDYGYDNVVEYIDFYLDNYKSPTWSWFTYNIDSIISVINDRKADEDLRAQLRRGAKEWLKDG